MKGRAKRATGWSTLPGINDKQTFSGPTIPWYLAKARRALQCTCQGKVRPKETDNHCPTARDSTSNLGFQTPSREEYNRNELSACKSFTVGGDQRRTSPMILTRNCSASASWTAESTQNLPTNSRGPWLQSCAHKSGRAW